MREKIKTQIDTIYKFSDHLFSKQIENISKALDENPKLLQFPQKDLETSKDPRGAKGMSAEAVFRAAILMRLNNWTYRALSFHISDSQTTKAFLRLGYLESYSHSTLQGNIAKISEESWEIINQLIVSHAENKGIEDRNRVRMDSTVVESNIHHPTDSTLLVDCMRVLERVLRRIAEELVHCSFPALKYSHQDAKKIAISILNAKNEEERLPLYEKLIVGCGDAYEQIKNILELVADNTKKVTKELTKNIEKLLRLEHLMNCVLFQTIDRVIDGKHVPSKDKIVSIFEDHTDIIVKGRRETEFGHKIFLSTGKSNMVLDCCIEEGNPADSEMYIVLLNRLKDIFKKTPQQTSADGGFASKENVNLGKKAGVKDVCFSKRCGLKISEMVTKNSIYKKLKNFRAGIESNISALKRGFGLSRAKWRGFNSFKSYVWSGIVAYNLSILGSL